MKKQLLLLVILLLPLVVSAYDSKIDGIYYNFDTEQKSATVTYMSYMTSSNNTAYMYDVVIPSEVIIFNEKYTVTSIGEYAFYNCTYLTSVSIPNSVTSIGNDAFHYCVKLTSVSIPSSVTNIGNSAFWECVSLTSVMIGNSVTSIGRYAFYGCSGLTSVTIGNSVTSIGESAFKGCSGLTSITIPNSVTSIGESAFKGCSGLTSVTIGNSVTSIGESAFKECSGLTLITFGNSVTSIGKRAFAGCGELPSITIPSSITSIGEDAFKGSRPQKTIWLTNTPPSGFTNASGGLNYVANNQYASSSDWIVYPFLSSVFEVNGIKYVPVSPSDHTCDAIDCVYDSTATNTMIASSVTYKGVSMKVQKVQPYVCYCNTFIENLTIDNDGEIAAYAFNDCKNIKTVTLGESITVIGNSAFLNCSSLQSLIIPNAVTELGPSSLSGCTSLANITFGNKLNKIGESAFRNCKSLFKISIPKSVTSIENYVFSGCTGLKEVDIEDRDEEIKLGFGVLWAFNSHSPLFSDCPLDYVYIGGDISYKTSSDTGYSPFYRNTSLREVVITDKETEISDNEFYGCTNLQCFTVGDGVEKFGNWAFSGCSSLKSLSFGTKLKTIGKEAFSDCTAVTEITSKAVTPPTCDTQALDDINKWNCKLVVPKGTLSAYQVANQWKDFFFISEEATNSIAKVLGNAVLIQSEGGVLTIQGIDDGTTVNVYSVNGTQSGSAISNNGSAMVNTNLQPGFIAIVKIGEKSVKVVVK